MGLKKQVEIEVAGCGMLAADWSAPGAAPQGIAVFVHGFASNKGGEKADRLAPLFVADGWAFLALDLRGHGQSHGSMEQLTVNGMVQDLSAALDWLEDKGPKPLLIGSSMGAAVVCWLAAQQPQRVLGAVLLAPAPEFPRGLWEETPQEAQALWKATGFREMDYGWTRFKLGFGLIEEMGSHPLVKLLEQYRAPTLIFQGMADEVVPWRESLSFFERLPQSQAELMLIQGGDHRLNSHLGLIYQTTRGWLKQHGLWPG